MEERDEILHYRIATEDEISGSDRYNMKSTLVYCLTCRYQVTTCLAGAFCKACNRSLIKHIPKNDVAGQIS